MEAQTLPRAQIELGVSKDFVDPELDRDLERAGACLVTDPESRVGRKHWRAMGASTAPWVTFLDDDDEFEPDRLARVAEVIEAHPELGLYRNRVRVIDGEGAPVPPERWRVHERDPGFDQLGAVYLAPDRKASAFEVGTRRTFATFNSSTMTFRRDLLEGEFGDGYQRNHMVDTYLYLVATIRPFGIFLDDRRLTRFRFTGASRTAEPRWFVFGAESNAAMGELAERHGRADFARYFRDLAVHYRRMGLGVALVGSIRDGATRREVARDAGGYLRYLGAHPAERRWTIDTWAAGLYGLAYAIAPTAVRGLVATRITRGRR